MAIRIGPNAYAAYDQFARKGVPPAIASALVGNMLQESGTKTGDFFDLNPLAVGDGGNSKYAVQWNGPRRRAYDAWAAERGLDPADVKTQADYVLHELGTTERKAFNAIFRAGDDPAEVARVATSAFWRPGDPRTENRMRYANLVHAQFAQNTAQANDAPPTVPATPAEAAPAPADGIDAMIDEAIRKRLGGVTETPADDVDAMIDAAIRKRLGVNADVPAPGHVPPGDPRDPLTGKVTFYNSPQERFVEENPLKSRAVTALKGAPFVGEYYDDVMGKMFGEDVAARIRLAQTGMEETRPLQTLALQAAGGLLATAPFAIAAAPTVTANIGTGLGTQVVRTAAVAAPLAGIEGFIAGLGEGVASLDNMDDATRRAFVSTIVGGMVGGVTPVAAKVARQGWQALKGAMLRRPENATKFVAQALGIAPIAAEQVRRAIEADDFAKAANIVSMLGDKAMLADAGPATRQALDTAIQRGLMPREVADAIEGRLRISYRQVNDKLNQALGTPVGVKAAVRELMQSTSPARRAAYDAAYKATIEAGTPDADAVLGIWARVPDSVRRKAASLDKMQPGTEAPAEEIPFPDFIAPARTAREPGEDSLYRESVDNLAEADSFFLAYREMSAEAARLQRKPLAAWIIRQGGIDPDSDLAKELYAMDIRPRSMPGLFRRGGLKGLDGIDPSRIDGLRWAAQDDTGNYLDPQMIQQRLVDEFAGKPVRSAEHEALLRDLADMERYVPEMEDLRTNAKSVLDAIPFPGDDPKAVTPPTVRQIDYVARELADQEEAARRAGYLGRAKVFGDLRRELLEATDAAVPDFKTARAVAAPVIQERKAIEAGRKLLAPQTTREDVADMVAGMSEAEKRRLAQGIRFQLDETIANVRAARVTADTDIKELMKEVNLLSSRAVREKLEMVLGPARSRIVIKELERASAAIELQAAVSRNSATFSRTVSNQPYEDAGRSVIGMFLRSPVQGAQFLVDQLTGETPEAIRAAQAAIAADVGRALTLIQGKDAEAAIALMQRAAAGQPISEAQARWVGGILATGLGLTAYREGVPLANERLLSPPMAPQPTSPMMLPPGQ